MKKYLLIGSFAGYDCNECEVASNPFVVGAFDTIEDCKHAVIKDIRDCAKENADCIFNSEDEEDEKEKYIEAYCNPYFENPDENEISKAFMKEQGNVYFASNEYSDEVSVEKIAYRLIDLERMGG